MQTRNSKSKISNCIPSEIQEEIMKRLPVKSLLRFRSVSKSWNSLIRSSQFIADYQTKLHHILVRYQDPKSFDINYLCITDDDSFPRNKFPLPVSMSVKQLDAKNILGRCSFQGVFCFYNHVAEPSASGTKPVVLWNPSVRKSVVIHVPNVFYSGHSSYNTDFGFGGCPHTSDPMLVKINYYIKSDPEAISCIPWQVEVYTLSSRVWRSPRSNNLPRKSIRLLRHHVAIDGFIYWSCTDGDAEINMILSFDTKTEEFTEISLPNNLAHTAHECNLDICKLWESLVVIETDLYAENLDYTVWMMEHGVPNSFTKLYTVKAQNASLDEVRGFRKTGEPIIMMQRDPKNKMQYDTEEESELSVYDPWSEHIYDVGISVTWRWCFVSSYMETLLLLDH